VGDRWFQVNVRDNFYAGCSFAGNGYHYAVNGYAEFHGPVFIVNTIPDERILIDFTEDRNEIGTEWYQVLLLKHRKFFGLHDTDEQFVFILM
jgi:hypothetical protein